MISSLRLMRTEVADDLAVWQMKLGSLPLASEMRQPLADFLLSLMRVAAGRYNLIPTVWIEATYLHLEGATKLLAPHARQWIPRTGFGIRPDGTPPRMWTGNDFSGAVYGTRPPVFNNQVFEISRETGHRSAIETMAGRAVLTMALLAGTAEEFKQEMNATLGPMVQDGAFHAYSFFFPLLSVTSVQHPQIATWMGNAKVYVRELFEQESLMIVTRVPLETCLTSLGGRSTRDGVWELDSLGLKL